MTPGANMARTNQYRTGSVRKFKGIAWKYVAKNLVRGQPAFTRDTVYYGAAGRYRWDSLQVYAVDLVSQGQ